METTSTMGTLIKKVGTHLTVLSTALALAGCGGGSSGINNAVMQPLPGTNTGTGTGTNSSQYRVDLTADKTYLNVNGDTATITVRAIDSNGGGVADQTVTLAVANSAKVGVTITGSSSAKTDASGNASFAVALKTGAGVDTAALLKSGVTFGVVLTDASGAKATQSLIVPVQQPGAATSQYNLTVDASSSKINVLGDAITFNAHVKDTSGGAVAGQEVKLSIPSTVSGVSIDGSATGTSDASGLVSFVVRIPTTLTTAQRAALVNLASIPLTTTLTETSGAQKTTTFSLATYQPAAVLKTSILASKTTLNVLGDTATITVRALDANGGGVKDQTVTLSLPAAVTGALAIDGGSSLKTDDKGAAVFTLVLPAGLSVAQQQALLNTATAAISATVTETSGATGTPQVVSMSFNQGSGTQNPVNLALTTNFTTASTVITTSSTLQVVTQVLNATTPVAGQKVEAYIDSPLANLLQLNGADGSQSVTVTSGSDGRSRFTIGLGASITPQQRQQLAATGLSVRTRILNADGTPTTIGNVLSFSVEALPTYSLTSLNNGNTSVDLTANAGAKIQVSAQMNSTNSAGTAKALANQDVTLAVSSDAQGMGIAPVSATVKTDSTGKASFIINVPANLSAADLQKLVNNGLGFGFSWAQSDGTLQSTAGGAVTVNYALSQLKVALSQDVERISRSGDTFKVFAKVTEPAKDSSGNIISDQMVASPNRTVTLAISTTANPAITIASPTVTTDANGVATFSLTLPKQVDPAILNNGILVVATATDSSGKTVKQVRNLVVDTQSEPALISAVAPATILTGGGDEKAITLRVLDAQGGVVSNADVSMQVNDTAGSTSLTSASILTTDTTGTVTTGIRLDADSTKPATRLNRDITFTASVTRSRKIYDADGNVVGTDSRVMANLGTPVVIRATGTTVGLTTSTSLVSSTDTVTVNATVLDGKAGTDGNRQPISGVTVTLQGVTGTAPSAVTNASGVATFTVPASTLNFINGRAQLTAQVNSQNVSSLVEVVSRDASSFSFTTVPSSTRPTGSVLSNTIVLTPTDGTTVKNTFDLIVRSTNKADLTGKTITASTTLGKLDQLIKPITVSATPDANGFYTGTASYTLTVTTPGTAVLSADFSGTINGAQPATIKASVAVIAVNPSKMDLQADKLTISANESTKLRVVVRNAADAVVANQKVIFERTNDPSLGSLSSAIATTDANGVAEVTYTAGNTATAINGVQLKARLIDDNGQALVPAIEKSLNLTVAAKAAYVVLSVDNTLGKDGVYYTLPASISVLDASGQPKANQLVTLRVIPAAGNGAYGKGYYSYDAIAKLWYVAQSITCANEDTNQNFQLDSGEDFNGNSILDPRGATTILGAGTASSSVTYNIDGSVTMKSNDQGRLDLILRYPKEYGSWARVTLTANTQVAGTESVAQRSVDLPVALEDVKAEGTPAFAQSPFGTNTTSCSNPN